MVLNMQLRRKIEDASCSQFRLGTQGQQMYTRTTDIISLHTPFLNINKISLTPQLFCTYLKLFCNYVHKLIPYHTQMNYVKKSSVFCRVTYVFSDCKNHHSPLVVTYVRACELLIQTLSEHLPLIQSDITVTCVFTFVMNNIDYTYKFVFLWITQEL